MGDGDAYWVSGVKRDGTDRHRFGGGKVAVDRAVLDGYLALRGLDELDPSTHELTDLAETDVRRFHALENEPLDPEAYERQT